MPPRRALVVDDDYHMSRMLCRMLSSRGLAASPASNADNALAHVAAAPPSIIIIDIHMPGIDGIQLYKALRAAPRTRAIPLLLMSGVPLLRSIRDAISHDLGAGRIYEKLDLEPLLAHAEKAASTPQPAPDLPEIHILRKGPAALDILHHTLTLDDTPIPRIAGKPFDVLAALFRRDAPMTQEELLQELWPPSTDPKTVQMTVSRLRESLKPYPALQILTESRSYRLVIHSTPRRR